MKSVQAKGKPASKEPNKDAIFSRVVFIAFSLLVVGLILLQIFHDANAAFSGLWKSEWSCQNMTSLSGVDPSLQHNLSQKLLELEEVMLKMQRYQKKFPELEEVIKKMGRVVKEVGLIRQHLESGFSAKNVSANPVTGVVSLKSRTTPSPVSCPKCPLQATPSCPQVICPDTQVLPSECPICPDTQLLPSECPICPKTESSNSSDAWAWVEHEWKKVQVDFKTCSKESTSRLPKWKTLVYPYGDRADVTSDKIEPYIPYQCKHDSIPKVIHIFWDSADLCTYQGSDPQLKALHDNLLNTKRLNPNWKIKCYQESDGVEIIRQVEPKLVDIFLKTEEKMYKSDIWRLAILHLEGGFYVDADVEHLRPMDQILNIMDDPAFLAIYSVQNIIAVTKNHDFIKFMLQKYVQVYGAEEPENSLDAEYVANVKPCLRGLTAGPCFWKKALDQYKPRDIRYLQESRYKGRYYVHVPLTTPEDALFWSKFMSYTNSHGWDTFGIKGDDAHTEARKNARNELEKSGILPKIEAKTAQAMEWLQKRLGVTASTSVDTSTSSTSQTPTSSTDDNETSAIKKVLPKTKKAHTDADPIADQIAENLIQHLKRQKESDFSKDDTKVVD